MSRVNDKPSLSLLFSIVMCASTARWARAALGPPGVPPCGGQPPSPPGSAPRVWRNCLPQFVATALLLPVVICADAAVKGIAEEHRELATEVRPDTSFIL